jgi:hypothetical protein
VVIFVSSKTASGGVLHFFVFWATVSFLLSVLRACLKIYLPYPTCKNDCSDGGHVQSYMIVSARPERIMLECKCCQKYVYERKSKLFCEIRPDGELEAYKRFNWIWGWLDV